VPYIRKRSRTLAWSTSPSTGAYGIEAIWEGRPWIVKEFQRLTARIGHWQYVAGRLWSTKKDDAIREARTPPNQQCARHNGLLALKKF
jgi:hypothetical protein